MTNDQVIQICNEFNITGNLTACEEIQTGNINGTYKVCYHRSDGRLKWYVLQSVNTYIFKNPVGVMENIDLVTEHIRMKNSSLKTLHFYHTSQGRAYLKNQNGFWRIADYIPSRSCCTKAGPAIFRSAGEAFGTFQMLLSDFDASKLHETIPDFHDTRKRCETLWETVKKIHMIE